LESRLHKVQRDGLVVKTYRLLPYKDIIEILNTEDTAFFEDSKEKPLKPGTMWKAARHLSELMGKTIRAQRGVLRLNASESVQGYLFFVVNPGSARPKDKRA